MSRKNINQTDSYRVLLTDTLPYETPFVFSNYYFHAHIRRGLGTLPIYLQKIFEVPSQGYSKPFDFNVRKDVEGVRKLSLPHPALQLRLCSLYSDWSDLLLYLCSRSSLSLRYPSRVARHYFERAGLDAAPEAQDGEVETEPSPFEADSEVASSYFTYRSFNLQYKFFESYEFLDLEKRFSNFTTLDVHKCFYNIYTHTVCWAIKGRQYAKRSRHGGFENTFDEFMQNCNFGETNGIIVGPEFSRVFAEVIFQSLDIKVEERLANRGLKQGYDYVIRRYVDDYFIFSSKEDQIAVIQEIIEEVLAENRLYLNQSKKDSLKRPFLTRLSKAKMAVSKSLSIGMDSMLEAAMRDEPYLITRRKTQFVEEFRAISLEAREFIAPLAKYTLSIVGRRLKSSLKALRERSDDDHYHRLLFWYCSSVAEICEYLYCLCPSARCSLVISRIYLDLLAVKSQLPAHYSQDLCAHLSQRTKRLLTVSTANSQVDVSELNLLILDRQINPTDGLSERALLDLFGQTDSDSLSPKWAEHLDYFQLCTLVYYIRNHKKYEGILTQIGAEIIRRYSVNDEGVDLHVDTNRVLLALDALTCPWLSESCKKTVSKAIVKSLEPGIGSESLSMRAGQIVSFCANRTWFFDWNAANYLEKSLKRKELIPAY